MRFFLFFLSLFSILSAYSSQVIIRGGIEGFDNKEISINLYEDYISFKQERIKSQKIANTRFEFIFDLEQTEQIILKIEDKETSLFAEPGAVYNISLSYDEKANQGRAFDKFLDIQFILPQANETNTIIKNFNKQYKAFFYKNHPQFLINNAGKEIEAFIASCKKNSSYQANPYVSNYVEYALANLEDINKKPRAELVTKYLKSKPVLHRNKEYMNFFTQLFQGDFEQLTLGKKGQDLLSALVIKKDYQAALNEIKSKLDFEQDELAELYLLYGLFDVFHQKRIAQNRNLEILAHIKDHGYSSGNRTIAKNLIQLLRVYDSSQKAPSFRLKNRENEFRELSDFEGKLTYLNFWATWSIPSLREMQLIKKLHKEYGNKVNFVSINLDESKNSFEKACKNYGYDWTVLYGGENYKIREEYGVRTVPSYYLIDEKGKIQQAYAENPVAMDRYFYEKFKR